MRSATWSVGAVSGRKTYKQDAPLARACCGGGWAVAAARTFDERPVLIQLVGHLHATLGSLHRLRVTVLHGDLSPIRRSSPWSPPPRCTATNPSHGWPDDTATAARAPTTRKPRSRRDRTRPSGGACRYAPPSASIRAACPLRRLARRVSSLRGTGALPRTSSPGDQNRRSPARGETADLEG